VGDRPSRKGNVVEMHYYSWSSKTSPVMKEAAN
jgi:hypothetical protein